jgi:hypothetical protein
MNALRQRQVSVRRGTNCAFRLLAHDAEDFRTD